MRRTAIATLTATLVAGFGLASATVAQAQPQPAPAVRVVAAMPGMYQNCTKLNKVYPHGVGRSNAKDHTSGTRVTSFRHSTKLYKKAMSYNKGLDRDKDGIACERA